MGGSSGVLLSIFFTATGTEPRKNPDLAAALGRGLARMQAYGGARPGDRTMIDALAPAIATLPRGGIKAAAEAAESGAQATATMNKARAGRAASVNAGNLAGVRDPGAVAVAIAFAAAAKACA
jgi:dihydroxyacetone kinase